MKVIKAYTLFHSTLKNLILAQIHVSIELLPTVFKPHPKSSTDSNYKVFYNTVINKNKNIIHIYLQFVTSFAKIPSP